MRPARRRALALGAGTLLHGSFLAAVGTMAVSLWHGLGTGRGTWTGAPAWAANALLALQFPLVHSWLLSSRGRRWLGRGEVARTLGPSTYALLASWQLLATFRLWSPSGVVWWEAGPRALPFVVGTTALAWGFLGAALTAAGLGLQTGWIGWTALLAGRAPRFPALPEGGPFRLCRQPIYLGFAATLWCGPVWGPDRLLLGLVWTTYCALGPLHKERRFARAHGPRWEAYRARVPYLPGLPRRRGKARRRAGPQAPGSSGSMP